VKNSERSNLIVATFACDRSLLARLERVAKAAGASRSLVIRSLCLGSLLDGSDSAAAVVRRLASLDAAASRGVR
jgi:hypothetical protein